MNKTQKYLILDEKGQILQFCRTKGCAERILSEIKRITKEPKIMNFKIVLKNNISDEKKLIFNGVKE